MQFNDNFFDDLARSPGVEELCVEAAEKVAAKARASAPIDSGEYRDSISVSVKYQKRVVALVTAEDDKAMIIESKTGNLARSLRATRG